MSNFFNMDNGLFRALGKLADLMLLNILFLVCSLPIFTIGASFTAMYYVTLKLAENEEGYIARGFLKSFKQNFKQATIIWLILLFFGIVLVLNPTQLKNSRPETYAAIENALSRVTDAQASRILSVYGALWNK